MLEEEGNVTKGQLLDRDTKGVLYPETTMERVIGLDDTLNKKITLKQQGQATQSINLCFNVTDVFETVSSNVKVSPNMGLKIINDEEE